MQSLNLDDDDGQEAMNSYFVSAANGDIVQTPVALKPSVHTLNRLRLEYSAFHLFYITIMVFRYSAASPILSLF